MGTTHLIIRKPFFWVLALILAMGCQAPRSADILPAATRPSSWEVCFSPKGGCTDLIVHTLGQATNTVYVQAYSFTSRPIAQALVDARRRGVTVEAILDKSQLTSRKAQMGFLAQAGIPVGIDAAHAIAHNKVIIVDGSTVLTGSFNFTEAGEEHNAENLLVIRNRELAERYEANWRRHKEHSKPYP